MPIQQTIRINPLDLQKNTSIGVSLPFNGQGVFNKTFTTRDQIKSNMVNLILTNKGERIMNPEFGADVRRSLFEQITDNTSTNITDHIISAVSTFIPEVTLTNVDVTTIPDSNTINVLIEYKINISGTADQIHVQFI
jgi:phage baseplate assembly protein W